MTYSQQVQNMCPITKGPKHGPAPIPEEGAWVKAYEIKDISGYTHGVGWCAPQQGTCKLSLNIKNGVIEEALVETIGCSGMTHSAAMASEILIGKTILEALNTDLVCDAINTAMRELFLQIVYGRSQSAFSDDGLSVGAGLEDLGKGLRSMVGTMYGTREKGVRYLEMTEGYVLKMALDKDDQVCGYQFLSLGKMMDAIKKGMTPNEAYEKNIGTYGRYDEAVSQIDLMPTLFSLLNMSYDSRFYGRSVFDPDYTNRAFIATYQDLGYLEGDTFTILSPVRRFEQYRVVPTEENPHHLEAMERKDSAQVGRAIDYYQTSCKWNKR